MSATRFNQLLDNKGCLGITVSESKALERWLKTHFQGIHRYLFQDDRLTVQLVNNLLTTSYS